MSTAPAEPWSEWIGRTQTTEDILTASAVEGLCATLDQTSVATFAPQGAHWLCAPPRARQSSLGDDGHPDSGGFLPSIGLPRRMWASSRVDFLRPLAIGCRVTRTSTLEAITEKTGASGPLVFVEVSHAVIADETPCIRERQTLVYRAASTGVLAEPQAQPRDWPWMARWRPDPVMLFRYSALTFNGHRIHYDERYATDIEDYPGLVVQGPLMATLLLDLCAKKIGANRLAHFSFRGVGPAFCGETLITTGLPKENEIDLKVFTDSGRTVMTGQATIA
jgi:3-methylfumaryl-CoA hydratase